MEISKNIEGAIVEGEIQLDAAIKPDVALRKNKNSELKGQANILVFPSLDSANIAIDGSCGSSPKSVVKHAQNLFNRERANSGNYDCVFCVFDRDQHETFGYALDKINSINRTLKKEDYSKKDVFTAIRSIPAFEYWFLLHS